MPKKKGFKLYTSVTSYYTTDAKCTTNKNCYISQDCITGVCKDCNGLINPQSYSFQSSDTVTYQFQSMPTRKLNKIGKQQYKTKRTNYNCVPAEECKQKLDGVSKNYLLHRFDAINDKMFWPLIMEACNEIGDVIVHMDYSENLKEKPKLEVQSHHFSGEQHSLHCAVAHTLEGNKYFFHFSDEKNMTGILLKLWY